MNKVVAYYRVSTNDQNLGIDAQKSIVKQYCDLNSVEIISEYEEHESGKNNHRVQLAIALEETVKTGSYLIVAKIDRLTRVAYFGLQLCEKYKIIFCDHPTGAPNAHFTDNQRCMALSRRKNNSRNNEANRKAFAIVRIMTGNWTDKAKFLNDNGFKTSKGGIWRPQQVKRLVDMMTPK